MALESCDNCGDMFDADEWHPAAFGADNDEIYQFCSPSCKEAYLAEEVDGERAPEEN
jgi:hypothetical protein